MLGIITAFALPGQGQARGNDFRAGLHGTVFFFVGVEQSTPSSSEVAEDNDTINTLTDSPDKEHNIRPAMFGTLQYTFANERSQLFFSKAELPTQTGSALFSLGGKIKVGDASVVSLAYAPKLKGINSEAWEDPYLAGTKRQETDVEAQGGTLQVDQPFGVPAYVRFSYGEQTIEDEASGRSLSTGAGSLNAQEINDLQRDGQFHKTTVGTMAPIGSSLYIAPSVHYIDGDTRGDAFTFSETGGEIGLIYGKEKRKAALSVSYEAYDYKGAHPVFGKVRDDERITADFRFSHPTPFFWTETQTSYLVSFAKRKSNISFYESNEINLGVSLSYSF